MITIFHLLDEFKCTLELTRSNTHTDRVKFCPKSFATASFPLVPAVGHVDCVFSMFLSLGRSYEAGTCTIVISVKRAFK